jgi:carboxyl-terminal processing protease
MQKSRLSRSYFSGLKIVVALCLTLSVFLFPFSAARGDAASVSTATVEGRLAVFDDVWQTIHDRYYDANFHGVNWWEQRVKLRNLAADARDEKELYTVLRRLLTSLRDAHTRVYAPEEKFDWQRPRFVTIGLGLREIDGRLTIVAVDRGSDAERAGLRAGDIIETIDGQSALVRVEQKLREQPDSSTPQAAKLFAMGSVLTGEPGTSVAIEWKDSGDRRHRTTLTRRWYQRDLSLGFSYQRGVAIVTPDAFTHAIAVEFARATSDPQSGLRKARGIIVDLRNNGGGDATAMAEMASAFLPPATALGQFKDRHGNVSLKLETGATSLYTARNINPIKVPLIILSSERTSSAAEIFIAALKQSKRATVLGHQTCGCVLAVRLRHALPDGGDLAVSELDYQTARGARLEGAGIDPDKVINFTRQNIYAGHDPVMASALSRLLATAHH